jgi:hypothetical protein
VPRPGRTRADVAAKIAEHANGEPIKQKDFAARVGRPPTDGTLRRVLADLEARGRAVREPDGRWRSG